MKNLSSAISEDTAADLAIAIWEAGESAKKIEAMMGSEIWKDIQGYEGLYQVSNLGRIKSLAQTFYTGKNGVTPKHYPDKIMKSRYYKTGYEYVGLSRNGVVKKYKVHRLVAKAFVDNPENKPEIDHINTKRGDNRSNNLRWVDAIENQNNPLTINKFSESKMGDKNPKRLNRRAILQININTNEILSEYIGIKEAAEKLGFDRSCISRCCNGKIKHHKGYKWEFKDKTT